MTAPDDLVEAVAMEIYETWRPRSYPDWNHKLFGKRAQRQWHVIARAAIEAYENWQAGAGAIK